MKTETKKFLEFNGKTIFFVAADGQYWIALKPICEALNVNWNRQFQNLKDNVILSQLFAEQQMVAADKKLRKMIALPEFYVYGWLMQIQSESAELQKYQWECYRVLYNYFHGMITEREQVLKAKTLDELEIERLEDELEDMPQFRKIQELTAKKNRSIKLLQKLDREMVDAQLDIWKQQ